MLIVASFIGKFAAKAGKNALLALRCYLE